ncbi:MAG: LysR family transcriptional regulator [Pseudomonadales bacterium]|nr:LysR family transcriptional regulator [Pseudomonadales bacterium]
MPIDIRQLKHFDALLRTGSFVRAAEDQHLSQSALTKSIKSLEANLGTILFDRTTHSVVTTDAATQLMPFAQDVLGSLLSLEEEASKIKGLHSGEIRAGSGPFPLQGLMTTTLTQFANNYPDIKINIQTGQANDLLDHLERRELDLVVCDQSKFESRPRASDIEIITLPPEPIVVVHDAAHPIGEEKVALNDFRQFPWAAPSASPHFQRLFRQGKQSIPLQPTYRLEVTSACIDMVKDSEVLTVVPLSLARKVCESQQLSWSHFARPAFTNDGIHLLRRKTPSSALKLFIEQIFKNATLLAEDRGR